ncbi:hypothetical protein [Sphingobium sp. WCS2017Hpa-17]|uniref:hypothetical protein n=1 Tax=Sphingobium sp. WCS2017Hpa-17 TaxID=3073638 RepID=UPI00288AF84D|nr:hypothetical protein [Sphingobium sp. WCS2017Hpa-17]
MTDNLIIIEFTVSQHVSQTMRHPPLAIMLDDAIAVTIEGSAPDYAPIACQVAEKRSRNRFRLFDFIGAGARTELPSLPL